ncbi:MAG: ABC transporter ATP-binding protein [Candidatus Borkfalkiaceae bacterium]|nr:ABC transporter ATP-binding protein [Christensenellaceae bacterium]
MNVFFRKLSRYKKESILAPAFKLIEALCELFIPLLVADIIDAGIGGANVGVVVRDVVIMVALGLAGLGFSIIGQYFSAKAATGLSHDVRAETYKKMLSLPAAEVDRIGVPAMITAMTSDINQMQSGVNLALRLLLRSPFVVFGAFAAAAIIDFKTSLIFLALIIVLFAVVIAIMAITMPKYTAAQKKLDETGAAARENLKGVRVVRAFGAEETEIKNYKKRTAALEKVQNAAGAISSLLNPLTFALVNLAVVALLYYGGVRVNSGALTQGKVVALYDYMSQILIELVKFANLVVTVSRALACGRRIDKILSVKQDESPITDDEKSEHYLEFKDVSVRYADGGESLSGINFTLEKGQTLGVIGATGSGKTTLVNLLTRFYSPSSGKVFFDGKNVATYTTEELRGRVKPVLQKTALFGGSIKDNVLLTADDKSEQNLALALKTAQADDFVAQKDGGENAVLNQGGKNLSGGQRQRISVARAIAAKPELLILDDSSSALDYLTDLNLRRAIASLDPKPTVIIVSQRAAAVKNADKILVLDEGREVGSGTRDELVESCEVYREIETSQEKGADV